MATFSPCKSAASAFRSRTGSPSLSFGGSSPRMGSLTSSPRTSMMGAPCQAAITGGPASPASNPLPDFADNVARSLSRLFNKEKTTGSTTPAESPLSAIPSNVKDAVRLAKESGKGLTANVYHERAGWVEEIEGEIPVGLKGTLIRNGPGMFETGGNELKMPFDGDGLIAGFNFDGDGNVWFNNKFVRTQGFVEERTEGKQKYRGTFNRNLPDNEKTFSMDLPIVGKVKMINPLDMEVKDAANTNVVNWGGKILAMHERGQPHVLDKELNTLGTTDLDGSMQGEFMGAHVRMFKETDGSGRLIMFSVENDGLTDANAMFHEYDEDFNLVSKTCAPVPGAANGMYHDMAVTENYFVIVQNRINVDFVKLFIHSSIGQASLAECLLQDKKRPVRVHLIPRPGKAAVAGGVRSFEVPGGSFFTCHLTNAFEVGADGASPIKEVGDKLVLDLLCSKEMDFSQEDIFIREEYYGNVNRRTEPCRISINLDKANPSVVKQSMADRFAEMPAVHPDKVGRAQTHSYYISSCVEGGDWFGPNQGILKMSVDPMNGVHGEFDKSQVKKSYWQPESAHQFVGEPVFVPREGGTAEDDGFVMTLVFDSEKHKSHLVILDAQDLSAGPLATIKLSHHLPIGLHGMWTEQYLGPAAGTPNKEVYDIRQGVSAY